MNIVMQCTSHDLEEAHSRVATKVWSRVSELSQLYRSQRIESYRYKCPLIRVLLINLFSSFIVIFITTVSP